ncbi:MAG TPA: hypothetical protein VM532_06310 [Burkholderiales bacterium]|nr:hypothetical protein [Burkholderiales bacterium]
MFRVYLRDEVQQISEKTTTVDARAAVEAFEALVNRVDLDGKKVLAAITKNGSPVAHHKFNAKQTDETYYWRGRIDQLPIYEEAGRPTELDGGKRRNVYLDDDSWDAAKKLGKGNASDGIRKALALSKKPE